MDQGKASFSVYFKAAASALECNLILVPIEGHWSFIVERYHDQLKTIMKNLQTIYPDVPLQIMVDYANMTISHTIGPEGHKAAIFTFGAQQIVPIGN